jgi:predicted NBD/HSP70 family sugar kinase
MRSFLENTEAGSRQTKKHSDLKQIIKCFFDRSELTIPQICEQFKWSIPTGTKLVQELVKNKILLKIGKRTSSGGRRPDEYKLNSNMGFVIGIELLISSLKIFVINLNHEIIHESYDNNFDITDDDKAIKKLLQLVPDTIKNIKLPKEKIIGVGIGITGRVDKEKGISYTYLHSNIPLATRLEESWKIPVFIDNDTHLMALGEMKFGLAKNKQNAILINLSRGIAAAIISNGQLHTGNSGFAGEFGHIHIADNNRQCICGKKGCLETIVSGLALEKEYQAEIASLDTAKKQKTQITYKEILQLSKRHDDVADKLVRIMGENLGQAISILLHIFNPEVIIISGGFTTVGEKLIYPIAKSMNIYGLPQLVADCDLKISSLGESAVMLGSFSLVLERAMS